MQLTIGCVQNHRFREIGILIFQPRQRVRREGRGYRGRVAASNSGPAFDKAQVAEVGDVWLLHSLRTQPLRATSAPSAGRAIRIGRAAANDECCFAVAGGLSRLSPFVKLPMDTTGSTRIDLANSARPSPRALTRSVPSGGKFIEKFHTLVAGWVCATASK